VTDGQTDGQNNYDSQDRASIARAAMTVLVDAKLAM